MPGIIRSDVEALIEADVSKEIIKGVTTESIALRAFRRLPNMSTSKTKMRVLDALPVAYWVNNKNNNGKKDITRAAWDNKFITAAEIAVIVPIKDDLIDDADVDIWGEIQPLVVEAFHKTIDDAIITGTNKPEEWRADLLTSILNAGAVVEPAEGQSLYSIVNDAMTKVEESGFDATGIMGGPDIKGKFRMMLDDVGRPVTGTEIGNLPRYIVKNGAWDKSLSQMIVGDFSQAVYSIRQDITYKVLTEAVIQDPNTNEILYNLAQDDMTAIRFVMRLGWEIPNPINALSPDESVRFPFASVAPAEVPDYTSTVIFTVTNADGEAVKGAKISCGSIVAKTDDSGIASIELQDGAYEYAVKLSGHKTYTGTVAVSGDTAVTVESF